MPNNSGFKPIITYIIVNKSSFHFIPFVENVIFLKYTLLNSKGIVRESGNIKKCFDEFYEDFVISDELRKVRTNNAYPPSTFFIACVVFCMLLIQSTQVIQASFPVTPFTFTPLCLSLHPLFLSWILFISSFSLSPSFLPFSFLLSLSSHLFFFPSLSLSCPHSVLLHPSLYCSL